MNLPYYLGLIIGGIVVGILLLAFGENWRQAGTTAEIWMIVMSAIDYIRIKAFK